MITLRPARARGHFDFGWLDTWHTFSFGHYQDPEHMGFHGLRVLNDDTVAPGGGFPTHPHRDMEIVSYVLAGGLAHQDSTGAGSVIRPGDVQRMSAGSGVTHSEANASRTDPVHFLQIWLLPRTHGRTPGYEQKHFDLDRAGRGGLALVASSDGRDGSVTVDADVCLWAGRVGDGGQATVPLAAGRAGWLHVAKGSVELDGHRLSAGDGAAVTQASAISVVGRSADAEVLVFDLP